MKNKISLIATIFKFDDGSIVSWKPANEENNYEIGWSIAGVGGGIEMGSIFNTLKPTSKNAFTILQDIISLRKQVYSKYKG